MNGSAIAPFDLLRPFDTLIRPTFNNKRPYQLAVYGEAGYRDAKGFNPDGDSANVLRLWDCQQDAIAMLEGFAPGTAIDQLRVRLAANDNGVRGKFNVSGDLKYKGCAAFAARFFFARDFSFDLYLPMYRMSLDNVVFQDLTANISDADRRVHRLLTNDLAANVMQLGCLDIGPWTRTGVGDLTALFEWFRDFEQNKPFLKMVRVNWRVGFSMPTGLREDEDKLFAIPYGNDGAWSIPFALGLDLTLGAYFKLGVDVQLTHIFSNTCTRRIKTSPQQSELLLLQKTLVYKDYGITQRFNLYGEFYRFIKGLSLSWGYQYFKHGDDEISLKTQEFSNTIANTSQRLEEFTMHLIETKLFYDFGVSREEARTRPELGIFVRNPFNGKNVALAPTVGAVLSVDF
jgi:hypothetical protein